MGIERAGGLVVPVYLDNNNYLLNINYLDG